MENLELLEEVKDEEVMDKEIEDLTEKDKQKMYEEYMNIYHKMHTPWTKDMSPRRNDPCPCGSGKKFKNCCGKDYSDTYNQGTITLERNGK